MDLSAGEADAGCPSRASTFRAAGSAAVPVDMAPGDVLSSTAAWCTLAAQSQCGALPPLVIGHDVGRSPSAIGRFYRTLSMRAMGTLRRARERARAGTEFAARPH